MVILEKQDNEAFGFEVQVFYTHNQLFTLHQMQIYLFIYFTQVNFGLMKYM